MNKILGQRLRKFREELEYTQNEFAEILHCTETQIYYLETGRRNITYPTAYILSHEFCINAEYFLDENAERKNIVWNYSQGYDDGYKKAMKDLKRFISEVMEE